MFSSSARFLDSLPPHTQHTAGHLGQLIELTASSVTLRDVFLRAVRAALGGQPYSAIGLDIKRIKGDKLLAGAVDEVKALIDTPGSGITAHGAQARGGVRGGEYQQRPCPLAPPLTPSGHSSPAPQPRRTSVPSSPLHQRPAARQAQGSQQAPQQQALARPTLTPHSRTHTAHAHHCRRCWWPCW